MIVCSCNVITDGDLEEAVDRLLTVNPSQRITVGQVYRALGKRPSCGGCLSNAIERVYNRATCPGDCHDCRCRRAHADL